MRALLFSLFVLQFNSVLWAQVPAGALSPRKRALYDEHVFGGQPDTTRVLVRNAYVSSYNPVWRIPNWCAYHITPDYLNTPKREGRFSSFRRDPEVANPVRDEDYVGMLEQWGYARGHYAPFKVLGGDRDRDGVYANITTSKTDRDDDTTVFQGNYMTNIAPQLHDGFNGGGGLWYNAERWVQEDVVEKAGIEVWEFSGALIHDDRTMEKVGPQGDIAVPDQFYKVLIKKDTSEFPDVLVFLFPHCDHKDDVKEKDIFRYLVSVDYLEAISGLDFFNTYSKAAQQKHERTVHIAPWEALMD